MILELSLLHSSLSKVDWSNFSGSRVVIKGCSKHDLPVQVYGILTSKLQPEVLSIMYGEPCSTVPVYKKSLR